MRKLKGILVGLVLVTCSIFLAGCSSDKSTGSSRSTNSTGIAGVWDTPTATWNNVDWQ